MRVALLTDGIWPFVIGGMQKHSYYLCKYLSRRKIVVVLYHTTKNNTLPLLKEYFTSEELLYIEEHYIPYPKSDTFPGHYLRTSRNYSNLIYQELKHDSSIDIIYAKGLTGWELLRRRKVDMNLPPVCINVHGYEYYQATASFKTWLQQLMLRPAFRFINKKADFIYSYGGGITNIINEKIKRNFGIIEIPTGIEKEFIIEEKVTTNKSRTFIYLGRFERRKGVQELLKALELVKKQGVEFEFLFIGAIPEKYRIAYPFYTYLGEISDKQRIKTLLSKADVLVCPSYAEGMPNVIMEGMARGCAIIASDVGAISMQVSEENGWLIQPGSLKELSHALKSAVQMNDEELLDKKNASVNKVKKEFTWEVVSEKVIDSFKMILSIVKSAK